jgi:hypothetical protein
LKKSVQQYYVNISERAAVIAALAPLERERALFVATLV